MDGFVLEEKSTFKVLEFLSHEFVLYLYKSTIQPCMEQCCHVWAGVPSCYLELLNKLQKQICRTVGPLVAASHEPLGHCWNVASLSLFSAWNNGQSMVIDWHKKLSKQQKALSNSHHDCHYQDIITTFINFNSFANSSKTSTAAVDPHHLKVEVAA